MVLVVFTFHCPLEIEVGIIHEKNMICLRRRKLNFLSRSKWPKQALKNLEISVEIHGRVLKMFCSRASHPQIKKNSYFKFLKKQNIWKVESFWRLDFLFVLINLWSQNTHGRYHSISPISKTTSSDAFSTLTEAAVMNGRVTLLSLRKLL